MLNYIGGDIKVGLIKKDKRNNKHAFLVHTLSAIKLPDGTVMTIMTSHPSNN